MFDLIRQFPDQIRRAVEIGRSVQLPRRLRTIDTIVLTGLGGSAIGGDLLRSTLAGELRVPFLVNRHYTLPAFVGRRTLVLVSSYSGGTEETISAHREALRRGATILAISSGGITGRLAARHRAPWIQIPGGLPPRAALGYSFFPLLIALGRLGLISDKTREIGETVRILDRLSSEYAVPDPSTNRALQLAERLRKRIVVVYSSADRLDAVNTRWRGQLAENAKTLAFGHVIPEMNHNEIVGWRAPHAQMQELQVIMLRDRGDHPRVQKRIQITTSILSSCTPNISEVWSEGASPLARVFSLVHLGDWTSVYLAVLNGEDPTPVAAIDHLKQELART
jgi:glucose/mannose-6-phosphate isomerase